MRESTCCFTGHRPENMEYSEKDIRPLIEKAIDEAIEKGITTFITGMAMGTDIWAAEIVLEKKEKNHNIRLLCALPHPNFDKRRNEVEKIRFKYILKKADEAVLVNNRYFSGCYHVRNKWMVDHSDMVIAVYNGSAGGTRNTVSYAKTNGVEVINII